MPIPVPPPSALIVPQPQVGLGRKFSLAGSAYVGWSEQDVYAAQTPEQTLTQISACGELTQVLSAPRPDLCGLTLERPLVMGILNATPDSFSDGGRHFTVHKALMRAQEMVQEGVDIIDIGGESTRPGSDEVDVDEEIARIVPVITAIRAISIKTPISIDTRKAKVAAAALNAGANIINDVTAMRFDPDMARVTADYDAPICLMHSVADPATMQNSPKYDDVVWSVRDHLAERVEAALKAGIKAERIILDPGIGFGKTTEHNLTLLQNMTFLHSFGLPVLLGVSRKRFIGEVTKVDTAAERVMGSVAVALQGALAGMHILRVHDTKATIQALQMWQAMVGLSGVENNVA